MDKDFRPIKFTLESLRDIEQISEFLASPDGLTREEVRDSLQSDEVDLDYLGSRYANFMARVTEANLLGANLRRADLSGVILSDVKGLDEPTRSTLEKWRDHL